FEALFQRLRSDGSSNACGDARECCRGDQANDDGLAGFHFSLPGLTGLKLR
ncbi:MAG: hypothetical protein JWR07_5194, partial [Nevskia sp.]|nr:hypothetical protein [Nevskia sp.]